MLKAESFESLRIQFRSLDDRTCLLGFLHKMMMLAKAWVRFSGCIASSSVEWTYTQK
jgi:hypothetical protein